MRPILVLGPSQWLRPRVKKVPLDVRREIANVLRQNGREAWLLEDHPGTAGAEAGAFAHFSNLVTASDAIVVYWPFGARLHGLEVEIGHLLTLIDRAEFDPGRLFVLAQETRPRHDPESGTLSLDQRRNRTRYHDELLQRGATLLPWSTARQLEAQVLGIALDFSRPP